MTPRDLVLTLGLLLTLPPPSAAQSAPPIGVRAAGMGGAFTAVADDGTAPFWNPAGLASGSLVGLALDVNALDSQSGWFVGLATPPLGISYYRTSPSAFPVNGRNAPVVTSAIHHAGVTLVQSLGDHGIAIGSTLQYVHGNGADAFDANAGVMASGSLGQIGVTVHNLFAPSLGTVRLDRRVRAGVAIHLRQNLTAAGDVEFTKTPSPAGEWRDAALGVEAHPFSRAWLRSGVHWNTASGQGGAKAVGSAGASCTVYGSLRADAQVSFGPKESDTGWGIGLSFVF